VLVLLCAGVLALIVVVILVRSGGSSHSGPRTVDAAVATDVQSVDADVRSVRAAIGVFQQRPTQANFVQVAHVAQEASDNIRSQTGQIASDAHGFAGADLYSAANELATSMGAVAADTSGATPATAPNLTSLYQQALTDWNAAVSELYEGTTSGPPPTIA
jgi:hypothetical protein